MVLSSVICTTADYVNSTDWMVLKADFLSTVHELYPKVECLLSSYLSFVAMHWQSSTGLPCITNLAGL